MLNHLRLGTEGDPFPDSWVHSSASTHTPPPPSPVPPPPPLGQFRLGGGPPGLILFLELVLHIPREALVFFPKTPFLVDWSFSAFLSPTVPRCRVDTHVGQAARLISSTPPSRHARHPVHITTENIEPSLRIPLHRAPRQLLTPASIVNLGSFSLRT